MRVYEFAKEHGISSKDALGMLRAAGFNVANHMAQLSGQELRALDDSLKNSKSFAKGSRRNKVVEEKPKDLVVEGGMSLGDFAEKIKQPINELIIFLLHEGVACNINQTLTEELMGKIADHYEIKVDFVGESGKKEDVLVEKAPEKDKMIRPPVVVVIGHVDHGKTTLLDHIRKTRVAEREKGGITQHLGAYEVETSHGKVVFLDTPGHEAFDKMRKRGIKVADMAILIVAADDGVMPQTVEAIEHARSMDLPMLVAINKVDKVDNARIESTLSGLSQHGLLVESWGGDVVSVPISAKEGTGVDDLLEVVALQAEVLELKARTSGSGIGYVLESKLERGRGPVGTVLLQHGQATVGDYFIAGKTYGRISSVLNTQNKRINSFGVATPVGVSGFDSLADAGDIFKIVPFAEYKKVKSDKRTFGDVNYSQLNTFSTGEKVHKVILKVDTNSSREALTQSIQKLSSEIDENIVIVSATVGSISEGDVSLAATLGATILGFGVKTDMGAVSIARRLKVSIKSFYVIYHLIDALKLEIEQAREPEVVEEKTGEAMVIKVFDVKRLGVIAGCQVKSGKIVLGGSVVVYRNHDKVGEGVIKTLQKEKRSQKEVLAGFECAFIVDGFSEWQEGDRVESYIQKKVEK